MTTRVLIEPAFRGPDRGEGGIRRVVEAQRRWLPSYGIEVVDDPALADVVALHAGNWVAKIAPECPTVAHCHGLYWDGYSWPKWALSMNKDVIRSMRQSDVVTAPSKWVAQAVARATWHKPEVLYHGIEPDEWVDLAAPGDYVLWNKTRPDPICDPTPMNELAKRAPDVRFVSTFGDGAKNVEIVGLKSHHVAKEQVKQALVYLATSRETFGIGTLEAMVAGVPVLGWDWGGQAEFVEHYTHGYLAKPGDYDDLLRGLRYCIQERATLSRNARSYVFDHFTNEQRVKPYAELYERLHKEHSDRPRVSVVMPYYNLGKYVQDAVKSVTNQTLFTKGQVELIIVDDASPEPLPEAIEQLAVDDPHVRIVRNEKNLYLSETLNAGIEQARGRFIVPLDADNAILPETLELLAGELDADRTLDIAYGRVMFVPEGRESERFISTWPPEAASLDQQLAHRNQIPSTSMYRRRVWERVGGYRRRCHTAEDADFWTRALSVGFTGRRVTDAVTLVYRDRSGSMSHANKDWDWHRWYGYAQNEDLRLCAAGGSSIPSHEFPLVSVVIPVGPGHERYMLDALDSLQNQTFKHWEAIVVNDTGKDLPWAHPWARVVERDAYPKEYHAAPLGVATARNTGMHHAKGRYVLFLDADDWLQVHALGTMYDAIRKNGGFIYSDWFRSDTGSRDGELNTAPDFVPEDVTRRLPYPVTCMYDLEELRAKGIKFDVAFNGKGWEDWDFHLQAIAEHGLCGTRVAAPLFHYRYNSGSLREKAFAQREQMKEEIFNKWAAWIKGEKENMARCGGCGGGYQPSHANGSLDAATSQAGTDEEFVLMEYTGDPGKRGLFGRATGNRYVFDSGDSEKKQRRIRKPDVEGFLATGWFKTVPEAHKVVGVELTLAPLMAQGPPQR